MKTWLAALELHRDKCGDTAACVEEATHSVWPQVEFFLATFALNGKLDSVGSVNSCLESCKASQLCGRFVPQLAHPLAARSVQISDFPL